MNVFLQRGLLFLFFLHQCGALKKPVTALGYNEMSFGKSFKESRFLQTNPVCTDGNVFEQLGMDFYGTNINEMTGLSVSLSSDGNVVAMGSPYSNKGSVRVYKRNSDTTDGWVRLGSDILGDAQNDYFGQSVSLSQDGKIVAVGASQVRWNNGQALYSGNGYVKVFQFDNSENNWKRMGEKIKAEGITNGAFGAMVSLSNDGERVAIGGPGKNGLRGHARVLKFDENGDWVQLGHDLDGAGNWDSFGHNISLSRDGKIVAVGSAFNDGGGNNAGHVRVFKWEFNEGKWIQLGENINGEAIKDYSGKVSLSEDGSILAIGANKNDNINGSDAGHIRVWKWDNNGMKWNQMGDDIDGDSANYHMGYVSLSMDGKTLATGQPNSEKGHVKIFKFNDSTETWEQLGRDFHGQNNEDNSGRSVSISGDGETLAIGAPMNGHNGIDSGHVRVIQMCAQNTESPTTKPSQGPSYKHSTNPSIGHSSAPSKAHSSAPTNRHSLVPSNKHSSAPSTRNSSNPSNSPSPVPTNKHSTTPSIGHSSDPSKAHSSAPSSQNSLVPSKTHSSAPSSRLSSNPSSSPTLVPTYKHSTTPSTKHSSVPTKSHSSEPTNHHSSAPSNYFSQEPSIKHSTTPSIKHSSDPSKAQSSAPTNRHSLVPSNKHSSAPSTRHSSNPSSSPTLVPTNKHSATPSIGHSSAPSTDHSLNPSITPWVVGNATFDVTAGNSFNSSLNIHHTIGNGPDQVNVILYKYDCETMPNGTDANLVIISNKTYNGQNNPLSYDIDVNKTLISNSSMVKFEETNNGGKSIGVVKFCTKVTTILDTDTYTSAPINVSFRKTNFLLSFDLTDNTLSGGSFGVQAAEILDIDVDVEDAYDVEVCQCAVGSFDCVNSTFPPVILQDEKVAICLNTSSAEAVVSNFNLRMTNSDTQYFYEPVTMGSGAWAINSGSLTTVFKDGNKLRIETFVVQGLFKNNEAVNTISVSGNAYLEFVSSQKDAEDTKDSLVGFDMKLVGEAGVRDEGVGGCINTIITVVSSFFE